MGGPDDRATDASVAYDAKHGVWLVSTLTLLEAGGVHGNSVVTSRSTDGGLTWSAPSTNLTGVIGGQPVVRPDGTVIVPIDNANETALGAFHSTNGGASWSATTTIALLHHHTVGGNLREGPLPSAEIDGNGTVYVAWADCVASGDRAGRTTSSSATP